MLLRLKNLWSNHKILSLTFIVATLATAFFAIRLVFFFSYWNSPENMDQDIAGWMTPRYVAYSWDVPPDIVATALGLELDGRGRSVTLKSIANGRGIEPGVLAEELEAAIKAYRQSSDGTTND